MKRLGLVGCAHIHTPNFVKIMASRNDLQVVSVWDHDADRARNNAQQLQARTVDSLTDIWQDESIDSVVICSETNLHEKLVLQAAAAGKNVYAEKPLGISAAESWNMAKAITDAGVIFQTGYMQRGWAINQFVRQKIQEGAFGKVTRLRHINCHAGSLNGWFDREWRWMADPKIAGVGAFGDLGFHSLDLILWMLGTPQRVTATTQVVTGRYGDCDETGEAILQFPNGTIATMAAAWVDVQQPVTLTVSGTEGHAYVCNGNLFFKSSHVEGADGLSPWTALPAEKPHAFVQYLDAIVGKPASLIPVREAALTSAVMHALCKAAANQTWEKPDLD